VRVRQLSQHYLGLALQALGREAEAIEELTEAIKIEPAAPIVSATQQLLTALRERAGEKPLRIELTLNAQYDSNIAGLHRPEASFGNLVNARVDYTLYKKGPWESTATYSFLHILNYQNRAQDSAHDYDVQDHLIAANLYYRTTVPGGLPATLGIQLNNDLLRLGGKKFLQRPTGTLSVTVQENPSNFTTLLYRAQYKHFYENPISIEDRRNTLNQLVGLLHYIRFAGGQYQIYAGYNYDDEDFGGTNWRYTGHKAIAGLQIELPWELQWATNVEYHLRDYHGTNTIFVKARRDAELTALTSLSRPILKTWCPPANERCLTLTLQHLWDNNHSAITYYKTQRQVIALGLTWRY
jgi:hypothetical protein